MAKPIDIENIINRFNITETDFRKNDNYPEIVLITKVLNNNFKVGKYYTAFIDNEHVVPTKVNPSRFFGKYLGIENINLTAELCSCQYRCNCPNIGFSIKHKFEGSSHWHISTSCRVYHYYSEKDIEEYKLCFHEYIPEY